MAKLEKENINLKLVNQQMLKEQISQSDTLMKNLEICWMSPFMENIIVLSYSIDCFISFNFIFVSFDHNCNCIIVIWIELEKPIRIEWEKYELNTGIYIGIIIIYIKVVILIDLGSVQYFLLIWRECNRSICW